jgi:hypothetical protein
MAHQFLAGWYTTVGASPKRLDAYRRAGANLVVAAYAGEPWTSRWLRTALAHGIKVLLMPDASWISTSKRARLRAFVLRYRHNPAVYGWYLYDEPDFTGLPPDKLAAAYRLVKSLDPSRPIAAVFTSGRCRFGTGAIDPRYLAGFDLLMFDRYPFYQPSFYRTIPRFNPLRDAREVDANCVRSARVYHKLGPIMVLQGFGKGMRDGPFAWRDPSFRETSCTFRLAAASGARGVLFWSDQYADEQVQQNVEAVMRRGTRTALAARRSSPESCWKR